MGFRLYKRINLGGGVHLNLSKTGVGISAGVTALTSALPKLQPHTLALCLFILAILAIVNLRGVKDTGTAFIVPTFLFIGTLMALIAVGVIYPFALNALRPHVLERAPALLEGDEAAAVDPLPITD